MSARRRRRLGNVALDALTWGVLALMLAPVLWLLASSLQPTGRLASGSSDLLHPTFAAFGDMWSGVALRALPPQQPRDLRRRGDARHELRGDGGVRARALPLPRA